MDTQIQDIYLELTDIKSDISNLEGDVSVLDARVTSIEDKLNLMNHGTLSIVFDGDQDNGFLRVKGEAPIGTAHAEIIIRNENRDTYTGISPNPRSISIDLSDNSYKYDYTNVLDWDW